MHIFCGRVFFKPIADATFLNICMISADGVFFKDAFSDVFRQKIILFGRKTAAKSQFLDYLSCNLHKFVAAFLCNTTVFLSFLYMYIKPDQKREKTGRFEGTGIHTYYEGKKHGNTPSHFPSQIYFLRKGVRHGTKSYFI